MYAKQQAEAAASAGASSGEAASEGTGSADPKKDEGDVVDAEYTEVKDKK